LTGGRRNIHQKKRKYELGRPSAFTKIGAKRIHEVRVMGGNFKQRAMRLETGNFSWGTEVCTRRTRILDVVYNASNNELVRTKTLVKGAIVQIDAVAFKTFYEQRYGVALGKKKKDEQAQEKTKKSKKVTRKLERRRAAHAELDQHVKDQFNAGRLYAIITSRPGQSGRADGYILEGKELEFYLRKIQKKK
jgi:small subunit ribosomal protein S8e